MKIILSFVVLAAIVAILFISFRLRVAAHGTFDEIPTRLAALKHNTDPTAFVGFCTRDEDALYFVYEDGAFNLDYELYNDEKLRYAEPFKSVVLRSGLKVVNTTYDKKHSVLRVRLSPDEKEAAEQGFKIAHELFGLNRTTQLQFLP